MRVMDDKPDLITNLAGIIGLVMLIGFFVIAFNYQRYWILGIPMMIYGLYGILTKKVWVLGDYYPNKLRKAFPYIATEKQARLRSWFLLIMGIMFSLVFLIFQ